MADTFDPTFSQLQRILDLRVQQHGLISSNLANANTPNYKAREIDFSSSLMEIMERPDAPMAMSRTDGEHLGGRRGVETPIDILEQEPPAWSADGNSVNPEEQSGKLMENTLMYKTLARMLRRKFDEIRAVVGD